MRSGALLSELALLGLFRHGLAQLACGDDAAFLDGAGGACGSYQGYGCDDTTFSGGTSSDDIKAACPISCGICSGEFRTTCHWDASFTFAGCCDTANGPTGDGGCWFGTTQYGLCCDGWSPVVEPPPPPPPAIPTDCAGLADGAACDDQAPGTDNDTCTDQQCVGVPANWWCTDQPAFTDEAGFACSDWADPSFNCVADTATYSPGGREALYAACAATCGLCQDWLGTAACWGGDSSHTSCCDTSTNPTGDDACWDGAYNFDTCQCVEPAEPICSSDSVFVTEVHGDVAVFILGAEACDFGPTHGQPGYTSPYGRCVSQEIWGNGWCDDRNNSPNGPSFDPTVAHYDQWHGNLNCDSAGFDGGDCLTGADDPCPTHGDVLGCDGVCYAIPDPPNSNPLGDGICDARFNCESRQYDRGDCAPGNSCTVDYSSWVDCDGNCRQYIRADGVCDTDTELFGNFACDALWNDDGDCLVDCTGQEPGTLCNDGDFLTQDDTCQLDETCVGAVPDPCQMEIDICIADLDCLVAVMSENDPSTRVDELLVAMLADPLGTAYLSETPHDLSAYFSSLHSRFCLL
jgi:hypothetical protein